MPPDGSRISARHALSRPRRVGQLVLERHVGPGKVAEYLPDALFSKLPIRKPSKYWIVARTLIDSP